MAGDQTVVAWITTCGVKLAAACVQHRTLIQVTGFDGKSGSQGSGGAQQAGQRIGSCRVSGSRKIGPERWRETNQRRQ